MDDDTRVGRWELDCCGLARSMKHEVEMDAISIQIKSFKINAFIHQPKPSPASAQLHFVPEACPLETVPCKRAFALVF